MVNRRTFLSGSAATLFAAGTEPKKRPNIVVVVMDDLGYSQFAPNSRRVRVEDFDQAFVEYLKRNGVSYDPAEALDFARRAMPTLEGMAGQGVLFTNAYASSSLCAPSRAGLRTGRLQNRFGHYHNIDVERSGLPRGSVLAQRLQQAGYATGFIGKWHAGAFDETLRSRVLEERGLTPRRFAQLDAAQRAEVDREIRRTGYLGSVVREHHPLNYGFDYYFGYNRWECPFYDSEHIWENSEYTGLQPRYNTELFTDKALSFIRRAHQEGKPFFIEVSYHAVHGPLKPKAPARYFEKLPSSSYELTNFYAHVNAVDAGVAAIRTELMRQRAWENTLVFFCSDNGAALSVPSPLPGNAPFFGHKGMFLQGGMRIPMMAHWPMGIRGGQIRDELVSMLDIMPTALDAAAVGTPRDLDGATLLPLLAGQTGNVHDRLMWAGIHARAWGFHRERAIGRAQDRREESPGAWVVNDGRHLLRFVGTVPPGLWRDVPEGAPPQYELFDLTSDPGETNNLIGRLPAIERRLKEAWFAEAGSLPPPSRWRRDRWAELVARNSG